MNDNNDPFDDLLAKDLVTPPDNFTDQVMAKISAESSGLHKAHSKRAVVSRSMWSSVALTTSAALGGYQLISFIFGIWIPTVAS